MEKYTWCIPSSPSKLLSDISLFDHAFSTANIAQALFMYHTDNDTIPHWEDDDDKFILMGGDLSGIQDYIFGISRSTGRGVSKIFRARSFYLQALTRSIVLDIQNRMGLSSVCRLVDSGGKFILLLPNTPKITTALEALEEDIQTWFHWKFKGLLSMNLSWSTCLKQHDFLLENFQSKLDEFNESLEKSKCRKLNKAIASQGTVVGKDYKEAVDNGYCTLCDINAADRDSTEKYKEKEGLTASVAICSDCWQQIDTIGTNLPKVEYLIYGSKGKIPLFGDIKLELSNKEPENFDKLLHVETLVDKGNFSRTRIARYLPLVTKEEIENTLWKELLTQGEEDGNRELREDDFKTFGMIAQKSKELRKDQQGEEKSTGRGLLGFLKADVDNLGLIFSLGLGSQLSAARFASVSRMLNIFFSEYLVELVRKEYPDIYVVFAGGDDLFMVGPWNQAVRFAIEMRKKLSDFCAQNQDITLSAGILATKPRFPMRRAVDLVEENLEEAKNGSKSNQGNKIKDSVCFLGESLSWQELEELMALGEKLDVAVDEEKKTGFSTAFLYRLLTYHKMFRKFVHGGEIKFGRYLSHAHYDIGRNLQTDKYDNKECINQIHVKQKHPGKKNYAANNSMTIGRYWFNFL